MGVSLRETFIQVTANSTQARSELTKLRKDLAETARDDVSVEVDVDGVANAIARVETLKQDLVDLDHTDVDPRIRIRVDEAKARLAELVRDVKLATDDLQRSEVDVKLGRQDNNVREVQRLQVALRALSSETASTERAMRRWASGMIDPSDNLNRSFRGMVGVLKQINPVVQALSLVFTTSLIPALLGVGSAAGGAVAGLFALVPAGIAVAGALGTGLVAVFKSVSQVMQVRQARQAALDSQTRQSAQRDEQLATANRALAEAQRAVRDAQQQRTTAARNLAQAERDAADGISRAQREAADASRNLREQLTAAYRAISDAATEARDAVLGLRDAQLDQRQAKLDLREAKRALADFARAGGKAMQDLGKQFEDVNFNPKALRDAVRKARDAGKIGGGQADELERLTLAVERARLREEKAANGVTDATKRLSDARKADADFTRRGIEAYKPYTDAVQRSADAQRELARATAEGIRGNPQVIAAQEALRDANERIVESNQRVADAIKNRSRVMKGDADGPMAIYQRKLKDLTDGQRALYDSLQASGKPFKTFRDLIADPILTAAAGTIGLIAANLEKANGWASALGQVGAQNIRSFTDAVRTDPRWAEAIKRVGIESLKTARILGGPLWQNFAQVMRNLAVAVLPLVNEGLQQIADSLGRSADRTDDWVKTQRRIRPLLSLLKGFGSIIAAALRAFTALGRAVEPVMRPFLDWIARGIDSFTKWVDSAKGQNRIQKFFADTLPVVKQVITLLLQLGRTFLQLYEAFAPVLEPLLSLLNGVLTVIGGLLEKFLSLPAPVKAFLLALIPIGPLAGLARLLFAALSRVGGVFGAIASSIAGLGPIAQAAVRAVIAIFLTLGQQIGAIFTGIWDFIRSIFGGIGSLASGAASRVGKVFTGALGLVKDAFSGLAGFLEDVFRGAVDVIAGILNGLVAIVKVPINLAAGAINALISAINWVIDRINAIPDIKLPFGLGSIGIPEIGKIPPIPALAKGGLATGSTLAQIGEGRFDEAVVPLSQQVLNSLGRAIVAATPAMAGDGRSGTEVNLNVYPQVPGGGTPEPTWLGLELKDMLRRSL